LVGGTLRFGGSSQPVIVKLSQSSLLLETFWINLTGLRLMPTGRVTGRDLTLTFEGTAGTINSAMGSSEAEWFQVLKASEFKIFF